MRLRLALAMCLLVGMSPAATHASPRPVPADPALVVTGYAMGELDPAVLSRDAAALDIVGVASVLLVRGPRRVTAPDDGMLRVLRAAHEQGLKAELLVSNWSARTGDFDPRLATGLLSRASHRRAVARRLVAEVRRHHWDGLTLDIEAMRRRDRAGMVAFARLLRRLLPRAVPLSMDLGGRTSLADYRASGFDLPALRRHIDRFVVMTYDEHGPWSEPGPIGGLPWQRDVLDTLLPLIPASRLDLGVAGYGYHWKPDGSAGTISPREGRSLTDAAGVTPTWSEQQAEWTATLPDGSVLWWSDARSYAARVALADSRGLRGVALWVLGSADPLVGS